MRVIRFDLLRTSPPVLCLEPAHLNRVVQNLAIAIAAPRHEDVKDVKQLILPEPSSQEERSCMPIVSVTRLPRMRHVCRAEHIVQRLEDPCAGQAAHDIRGDVCDQLGVGIRQVLRALARGELEPLRIGQVAFIVVVGNEVPEVVVALRRIKGSELGFREVHGGPVGVSRPRLYPNLDIRVSPTHKATDVCFKLL
jgi:hypothetical protein